MRTKFQRALFGAAALAVASGGVLVSNNPAQAADPGTTANGSVTISPTSKPATLGAISLTPDPNPAFCPGDTVTGGYSWQTFISNRANDPATFTYSGGPSVPAIASISQPAGGTGFTQPLVSTGGITLADQNTAAFVAGSGGQIAPLVGINLGAYGAALVSGAYNIGYACSLAGATTSYWSTPITITAAGGYALGAVPAAPVLPAATVSVTGAPGSQSLTVPFGAVTATPIVTSYDVTATPRGGGAATSVNVLAAATPRQAVFNGLAVGIYDVRVRANNSAGNGAFSAIPTGTADGSGGYVIAGQLATIPGAPPVNAQNNTPVKVGVPTEVVFSGFPNGAVVTIQIFSAPVTLATVTDGGSGDLDLVANGSVRASVTIPVNDPAGVPYINGPHTFVGSSGSVFSSVNIQPVLANNGILEQEVIVDVPAGVIRFSQTCGKFAASSATPVLAAAVGLPGLPSLAGWSSRTATVIGNDDPRTVAVEYPLTPARSTAKCNIVMSTPTLIENSGTELDGAFFFAEGSLNQVTVIDSRDTDIGWRVTGKLLGDFRSSLLAPNDAFDGNYLGWFPAKATPSTPAGYTQNVTAGAPLLPGTGAPGKSGTGIKSPQPLASAVSGAGLGRADLDARMALYIPTSDSAEGRYTATLELTLLDL